MSQLSSVQSGDTVGVFCARHRLSREAFFHLNPHKTPMRLPSGVVTAELHEGETLRVGVAEVTTNVGSHFHPVYDGQEGPFMVLKSCAEQGYIGDEEKPRNGCFPVKEDDQGRYLQFMDGSKKYITPDKEAPLLFWNRCVRAGGLPGDGAQLFNCFKTGTEGGQFGYYDNQLLPVPVPGPDDKMPLTDSTLGQLKEDVKGSATPWLVGGTLVVGGLLLWKLLLGRQALDAVVGEPAPQRGVVAVEARRPFRDLPVGGGQLHVAL